MMEFRNGCIGDSGEALLDIIFVSAGMANDSKPLQVTARGLRHQAGTMLGGKPLTRVPERLVAALASDTFKATYEQRPSEGPLPLRYAKLAGDEGSAWIDLDAGSCIYTRNFKKGLNISRSDADADFQALWGNLLESISNGTPPAAGMERITPASKAVFSILSSLLLNKTLAVC